MKTSELSNPAIIRIINREILEDNLEPKCAAKAIEQSRGNNDLRVKYYFLFRLRVLGYTDIPSSLVNLERNAYRSTDQCPKRRSSRSLPNESKSREEVSVIHPFLLKCLANFMLTLGTASAALGFWSLSGGKVSEVPYLILISGIVMMLLLPGLISKICKLKYEGAVSLLCLITAMASLMSGVKLLKEDPQVTLQAPEQEQASEPSISINITPATEKSTDLTKS